MKINKLKKITISVMVLTMISSQLVFARGSGGSHASASHSASSHSSVSHSTSSKSAPSSSGKSGSFSSKSTISKPSVSSSAKSAPKVNLTKPKASTSNTKPATNNVTKSTTVHNTIVVNNSYHYIPSATYRTTYGSTYSPSFFDNYWFYRSLTHHNTVVVVDNGVTQEVNYGHSGIWIDIVSFIFVVGLIVAIVIFTRRRRNY